MSVVDTVLHKIFGTPHERKVKQLRPVIAKIHAARESLEALDDAALAAKSAEFREKLKNGATLDDIKVEGKSQQYKEGEQGYADVTGPYKYEGDPTGNTYYARIKFEDGRAIQPTGQSEHRDEVQFRISIPDAIDGQSTPAGAWDTSNDWSYLGGLDKATDLKKSDSINEHIPMYVNGELAWGEEPDGTKFVPKPNTKDGKGSTDPQPTPSVTTSATTTSATTSSSTTTATTSVTVQSTEGTTVTSGQGGSNTDRVTLWGDANCDKTVDVSDAVIIMQSLANPSKYKLTDEGSANGDVNKNGDGITGADALSIQKYKLNLINELPESYNK